MAMTREDNELLTRVENGAPMGEMIRQHYWLTAIPASKLEAGGRPYRVRLLGTNLVAFRNTAGVVGVMDELCPHRKASLALGRNADEGLRCIYHGWKLRPAASCGCGWARARRRHASRICLSSICPKTSGR